MIPPRVLQELRYIEIATTKGIRTARVGPYTSRTRGSGLDFDQHVPYRPGDDVRRIDWNVTARLNAPYLRQTHAERELDLVVAVDLSRSMDLGSGSYTKKEAMTFVTASLLFSAASDQVNIGFLAFADRVLSWTAPARATGRAWKVLEELWQLDPTPATTAVEPALRHLSSVLRTMSVVVLVSDFFSAEETFAGPELRVLAARHDVVAVIVEDAGDTALPPGRGFMRVKDVETGRMTVIPLNGKTRQRYAEAVEQRRRRIMDSCFALGIEHVVVTTEHPVTQPVVEMFARRRSA